MKSLFNKNIKFFPTDRITDLVVNFAKPAFTTVPEWYKNTNQFFDANYLQVSNGVTNGTVKRCTPFLDALTSGYSVVLSEDVIVDWVEENIPKISWRSSRKVVTDHSLTQIGNLPAPFGHHRRVFKWEQAIFVELPPGYSLLCTHPINRFDLPFQTITGVVDADKYQVPVHFPFFLREGWSGVIEAGTPIAQILPFKRDNWKSSQEKFDEELVLKGNYKLSSRLVRSYKSQFWSKKTYQ